MSLSRQPEPQGRSAVEMNEAGEMHSDSDLTDFLFQSIESPVAFGLPSNPIHNLPDYLLAPPDEGLYPGGLAEPGMEVLESGKPLSQCRLWRLMEAYYDGLGVNAWDSNVPCFITSSSVIADAYAEAIITFLDEHLHEVNLNEPLYIVEMATGIGRFSYLLLSALDRKLSYFPHLAKVQLRYIMTDFTQCNIDFWRHHEKFASYLERGVLDFARFRPEDEQVLHLQLSGVTLDSSVIQNPVIGLANYFFDSIRQDVFEVDHGQLYEGLVELSRPVPQSGTTQPVCFEELRTRYRYNPVSELNYYDDPVINQVLQDYCQRITQGRIIFPLGALRVINNLKAFSNNNLMLLSSDKSFTTLEHMGLYSEHRYALHGSISFTVNYDAVGRLFQQSGGHYFYTSNHSLGLETVCCILTPEQNASHPFNRLRYFFTEKLDPVYPIVTAFGLTDEMLEAGDSQTAREQIAIHLKQIKLNLYDPRIFCSVARKLLPLIEHCTREQRHDLLKALQLSGEKLYFYRGEVNQGYWFGQLYFALGLYQESLHSYELAKQGYSEYDYEYLSHQGHCYVALKQWDKAMHAYLQALARNPVYEDALHSLKALRAFLKLG